MSPMQQGSQDPFAAIGGQQASGMPSFNQAPAPADQAPAQQPQEQYRQQPPAPPQQQPVANADPWAAMAAAPTQPPPPAPPAVPAQLTPPPAVVGFDASAQVPPSPIGDVSVLAAATAANAVPAQALQPNFQPMQAAPAPTQAPHAAPVAAANPFDFGAVASAMPVAPPPAAMPPQAPPTPPQADVAAVPQPAAVPGQTLSPPLSPTPAFAPQQGFADPFGYALSPVTSPVTSPVVSPNNSPGAANNYTGAVVPSAAPNADPFGVFGAQQPPAPADPFGSTSLVTSSAPPHAGGVSDDPFGLFGSPPPAPAAPAPVTQAPAPTQAPPRAPAASQNEDPWAAAGFNQMVSQPEQPQPVTNSASTYNPSNSTGGKQDDTPITLDSNNLPGEGEYYEARINARSLGAMFYTARNLEDTLFSKMPNNVIEALGSRPVVAYVAENSAAFNSGVTLGHVILSVNGHEISDPEYCANIIRNCPRPMNLRCYVPPNMELTLSEGKHLVKYDTKDLEAPASGMEWKRKYVVVGGIVTKPWMMNMFYSKRDYDIAVKEAHAGHKISVKVKQFDLRGARIILKGKDGKPNWIDYPSERKPWFYITIMPNKGYPIKISSDSLEALEPVYSAIRRFVRKDMESRYQYRMEESFGGHGSSKSSAVSSRNDSRGSSGGYNQFADAPKTDSYWH